MIRSEVDYKEVINKVMDSVSRGTDRVNKGPVREDLTMMTIIKCLN